MIKVENVETYGWEAALRGMRNPLNSWKRADSEFVKDTEGNVKVNIGENDIVLMRRLFKSGQEHRKYMRQIFISMDVTAPLYWWKEADQYKVGGVTTNSCSTMHKIAAKEFTLDDFSTEHLNPDSIKTLQSTIYKLNEYRKLYNEIKDKGDWWQMIQLLPSSYNQKRTWTFNYETAYQMIKQRSGHKLDEWNEFVSILKEQLPYMKDIIEG